MENNKYLFGLCLFLLACNATDSNHRISIDFSSEWKSDSTGCLGMRKKIVDEKLSQIKLCIGSSRKEIVQMFGEPYEEKESTKGSIMFYWITCSKVKDDNQIERIDQDATQLAIDLDEKYIVKNIRLIVP